MSKLDDARQLKLTVMQDAMRLASTATSSQDQAVVALAVIESEYKLVKK